MIRENNPSKTFSSVPLSTSISHYFTEKFANAMFFDDKCFAIMLFQYVKERASE